MGSDDSPNNKLESIKRLFKINTHIEKNGYIYNVMFKFRDEH